MELLNGEGVGLLATVGGQSVVVKLGELLDVGCLEVGLLDVGLVNGDGAVALQQKDVGLLHGSTTDSARAGVPGRP